MLLAEAMQILCGPHESFSRAADDEWAGSQLAGSTVLERMASLVSR